MSSLYIFIHRCCLSLFPFHSQLHRSYSLLPLLSNIPLCYSPIRNMTTDEDNDQQAKKHLFVMMIEITRFCSLTLSHSLSSHTFIWLHRHMDMNRKTNVVTAQSTDHCQWTSTNNNINNSMSIDIYRMEKIDHLMCIEVSHKITITFFSRCQSNNVLHRFFFLSLFIYFWHYRSV